MVFRPLCPAGPVPIFRHKNMGGTAAPARAPEKPVEIRIGANHREVVIPGVVPAGQRTDETEFFISIRISEHRKRRPLLKPRKRNAGDVLKPVSVAALLCPGARKRHLVPEASGNFFGDGFESALRPAERPMEARKSKKNSQSQWCLVPSLVPGTFFFFFFPLRGCSERAHNKL